MLFPRTLILPLSYGTISSGNISTHCRIRSSIGWDRLYKHERKKCIRNWAIIAVYFPLSQSLLNPNELEKCVLTHRKRVLTKSIMELNSDVLNSIAGRDFISPQRLDRFWCPIQPLVLWVLGAFPGRQSRSSRLNAHFHLVAYLKLRMSGPSHVLLNTHQSDNSTFFKKHRIVVSRQDLHCRTQE
jgi:hypothetical protein